MIILHMTLNCFLTQKVHRSLVFMRINDHTGFMNIKNIASKWEEVANMFKTILCTFLNNVKILTV